jgi:hypothetical protein
VLAADRLALGERAVLARSHPPDGRDGRSLLRQLSPPARRCMNFEIESPRRRTRLSRRMTRPRCYRSGESDIAADSAHSELEKVVEIPSSTGIRDHVRPEHAPSIRETAAPRLADARERPIGSGSRRRVRAPQAGFTVEIRPRIGRPAQRTPPTFARACPWLEQGGRHSGTRTSLAGQRPAAGQMTDHRSASPCR